MAGRENQGGLGGVVQCRKWCAALVASVAVLVACGGQQPEPIATPTIVAAPTTAVPPHRIGNTGVTDEQLGQIMAELDDYRQWDVCPLHDLAAAKQIFGAGALTLDLAQCTFTSDAWTVHLRAGWPFDGDERASATTFEAAAKTFFRVTSFDPRICMVRLPTSELFALDLYVRGGDQEQAPCEFAEQYVTAVAGKWHLPPNNGRPHLLPLAGQDPCSPANELAERFAPGTSGMYLREMPKPTFCAVVLDDRVVTISFRVGPFEDELDSGPDRQLITLGHRSAVQDTGGSDYACKIRVKWSSAMDNALDSIVQVNSSADCHTGREAADIVVQAID